MFNKCVQLPFPIFHCFVTFLISYSIYTVLVELSVVPHLIFLPRIIASADTVAGLEPWCTLGIHSEENG